MIFILAAGEASRYGTKKQLLNVEGETVIGRIARQLKSRTQARRLVVTCDGLLVPEGCIQMVPTDNKTTCHTMLSTALWWGSTNIILFSDVYYSDKAMDAIFSCNKPLRFFSDGQDIFAISFTSDASNIVANSLKEAIAKGNNSGRLWELYRALHGLESWPTKEGDDNPNITYIGDRTQDFDTPQDYEDFLNHKSKNILCASLTE